MGLAHLPLGAVPSLQRSRIYVVSILVNKGALVAPTPHEDSVGVSHTMIMECKFVV